ncbi:MAG TPA: aminotransferase class V-fold PLP-dependent enzyme [Polyangiaceae bacterium LLY-WYZ-15_(1-7)]|nr:hypothetical protein [Sandaracinus sp.]HJL06593.1 aminotransferase class V-fold PLP-dependent enzyme [Polyangiaceae bacterium LLY-WYZ-15_(1-7)]HJL10153.1 aminotransferase class V-fold PLP-dependent enzyme [Polyangiaceae bacterium LLY-WYZ-15_(1-7)]HJL47173.1 aminotransferase class V-fold PLP-dependent enzyme [Polyangiaceae bacterium LLY-WYZ-15_(1-7)]
MPVYLDHHAATPLCAAARDAMRAAEETGWANPSSLHGAGRAAKALLEGARRAVAEAVGAAPADVVLTAGGTEACNLAVLGLPGTGPVVTTAGEHPAIGAAARASGRPLRVLAMAGGAPGAEVVEEALGEDGLLAVQWVSHETGAILPVAEWVEAARAAGARVVVDATQALGRLPVDVEALGADAIAFASHKIGGPAGAGALWLRRGMELAPRALGGGQERGRRAGTPHAVTLAGFGAACGALEARLGAMERVASWRDRLEATLEALGGVVNGAEGPRVASVTSASFRAWRGPVLVAALDVEGLQASAGAACSSGVAEASPGLRALYPEEPWRAESALRLSLGPEGLDDAAIEEAVAILQRVIPRA